MSASKEKERSLEASPVSPEDKAKALQEEVVEIRDDLTGLVNELDHRRHDLFDVRKQLSRHAIPLVLGGLGVVGLVAGGWALAARRRRRRQALSSRVARLRQALARMIDKPERVARSPGTAERIAGAAATAIVSVVARRLAERMIRRPRPT
jgi:hypothetical protein